MKTKEYILKRLNNSLAPPQPFFGLLRSSAAVFWVKGLVSEETVVLRRWGSETRKFGLSTELIM